MDGNQNRIYRSDAERFERWIGDLLGRFEFPVKELGGRDPLDFTIEYKQMLVAIDVKYFRTVMRTCATSRSQRQTSVLAVVTSSSTLAALNWAANGT